MDKIERQSNKAGQFFKKAGSSIKNYFVDLGHGIKNGFIKFGHSFVNTFANFHNRFVDGSIGTKISYFICGAGNVSRKQFVKGFLFFALQVLFILYMVMCPTVTAGNNLKVYMGYKSLINLKLERVASGVEDDFVVSGVDQKLVLLFGILTILLMVCYVLVWLGNIKSSYQADLDVRGGRKPSSFKEDVAKLFDSKFHILMLTPTCIAALIFTVLPTIFMICFAFTDYNIVELKKNGFDSNMFSWVGFENFITIFDPETKSDLGREIGARFLPVFGWTIIWAFFATFTCYFGGIILAILINKKGLKGKKIFRTCFIITIAVPQFITLLAMKQLLGTSGPFNAMLVNMGILETPIPWLGGNNNPLNNVHLIKFVIILVNMWLGIPYTMLMTSGILMNIPTDLYEAARVDGTSRTKMFFKITLPYVIFVTTPYLIGSFVGNINSFNVIFLLTGGGPVVEGTESFVAGETDLLVTWLYKLTIDAKKYNIGAVIGIFTFLITATITLITYRRSKAYKEEDTFQ